ncbi:hypothetical protein [Planomonospora sp. ID91781]|uniref:hypothetical protein n=1 Tax=Planomonospora sp. ID91781 TaxID=2738135 RepID=UPI0027DC35B6|nr:hypothetical protein [Planomonospora sp. ID91781]
MSIEWVNRAIDDLRAWGRAHGREVDADEARLLCDYASDYLDVNELGDFTSVTFEELLLNIYPRKVIAPPESAPETVAAARTLVDFLLETEEIGGKMAARMRATLDRIEPEMPAALADTSRFGMAKSLFSAMGADSLDAGEDSPPAEDAQEGEYCECPGCSPLPPVRLASREALAEAALRVPLLTDARRLVQWMLAGGRTPTRKGALRVRDAAEANAQLAVGDPAFLWDLAVHTGLVETEGAAVFDGDDPDPLEVWAATVRFAVEKDTGGAFSGDRLVDEELYTLLDLFYRVQAPVPVPVVREYLEDEIGLADEGAELDLEEVGRRLAYCGLLSRGEGTLELTPLAVWGLHELYDVFGIDAPEAPDLAAADATGLIEGLLAGVLPDVAESDIAGWLSRRSPAEAAAELLGAVSGAPAVARGIAVTIVDRLGAEAEESVRGFLEDAELRPHAVHWLSARGLAAPTLTPDEVLWMSVDMLALALPAAEEDPEAFAENMAASGPPSHMIEEMWRVDHPDAVDVLELLGRSLPDQNAAKAARKAAFKARSRAIG